LNAYFEVLSLEITRKIMYNFNSVLHAYNSYKNQFDLIIMVYIATLLVCNFM
jgi:hypothetical protein